MDNRRFVSCLLVLLVSAILFSGCTSSPTDQNVGVPKTMTSPVPDITVTTGPGTIAGPAGISPSQKSTEEQLASVKSESIIFHEAFRMFNNIKSTEYVHPPYTVDEAAGVYRFDCLGFVDHVLMNADPSGYRIIGKGVNASIASYANYFNTLDTMTPNAAGFTKVSHPADVKPGDICLWLKPSTADAGHMWIIAGEPEQNLKRAGEVLVRIFDSTEQPHTDDSRVGAANKTGLGSGILGFMVDSTGSPAGLYWEGRLSTGAGEKDTTIVCARLDR